MKEHKLIRIAVYCLLVCLFIANFARVVAWEILPGTTYPTAIMADSSETLLIVNLIYGGYWRSEDGGSTWTPTNNAVCDTHPSIACYKLDAYNSNADTIVARTFFGRNLDNTLIRQQISLSTDRGLNWSFPYPDPETNYSEHMLIDRNNPDAFYYVSSSFFARSDNFGETWSDQIIIDPNLSQSLGFIQDPIQDSVLFVSSFYFNDIENYRGLIMTTDLGDSWESLLENNEVFEYLLYFEIEDIDRLSNGDLLCCIPCGMNRSNELTHVVGLLRSTDNGLTWQEEYLDIVHRDFPFQLAEIPNNPGLLLANGYYANSRSACYSMDYGHTWNRCEVSDNADLSASFSVSTNPFNGNAYVCSFSEGIWKTSDCENWYEMPTPNLGCQSLYELTDNYLSYVATYGDAGYVYDSSEFIHGPFYYPLNSDDSVRVSYPVHIVDEDHWIGFASYCDEPNDMGFFLTLESFDNGVTWHAISEEIPTSFVPFYKVIFPFFSQESSRLILITPVNHFQEWLTHVSLDTGRTWQTYSNMATVTNNQTNFYQTENYVIAAHIEQGIFRSFDNCETWEDLELPNPFYLFRPIAVILDNETDEIYSFGGIVGYRYNGVSWDTLGVLPQNENIIGAAMVPSEYGPIFLLASNLYPTVHISTDGGYEWSPLAEPILYQDQMFFLSDIEYDPYRHRVWINSPLGMMWQDADYFTDVVERDRPELVVDYEILSVYPNPFNSVATAHFRIDTSGEFSMKLYNINGQEVQTLLEDANNPGEHTVQINAGNLSSGTYYLRLITEESEAIRKLVLVK